MIMGDAPHAVGFGIFRVQLHSRREVRDRFIVGSLVFVGITPIEDHHGVIRCIANRLGEILNGFVISSRQKMKEASIVIGLWVVPRRGDGRRVIREGLFGIARFGVDHTTSVESIDVPGVQLDGRGVVGDGLLGTVVIVVRDSPIDIGAG